MTVRSERLGHQGVAPTAALLDAGITRHQIRKALAAHAIEHVRRGWVALPDADPALRRAAELGVTITCVTRARRLGLWTFDTAQPHVAGPPHGRILGATSAHVH